MQNYAGKKEEQWETFISELESLPTEIKIIGINDYLFIDGYKKVLDAKNRGRLTNLELILPVIELRIDKFGGSDSNFSRVNCHIIFSNNLGPDTIKSQFLDALPNRYTLSPEAKDAGATWEALPTRESLEDLGKKILDSIPDGKRPNLSPLFLGFSNIHTNFDQVQAALQNHYFRNRYLIGVGKTEWADMIWSGQLIAEKKDIINNSDVVFTAADSPAACLRSRNKLVEEGVNSKLLDCSDAHAFSDSMDKDRIGNCFTWIKADPTFEGLQHALKEYDSRVFLGEEPPKIQLVRSEASRFISSIEVHKKHTSALNEEWFGCSLKLNHDLVTIIGKKGSGKSALMDIISLLADSHREEHFSFLTKERFRHKRENKAISFEATLTFENGTSISKGLNESVSSTAIPRVNYIPQNFFETICTEIAHGNNVVFRQEIEGVIFSRLDLSRRLGKLSLRELINYRTEAIKGSLKILREDLGGLSRQIVALEEKLLSTYREELKNKIAVRQEDLKAHESAKPKEVPKPKTNGEEETPEQKACSEKQEELEKIDKEITEYEKANEEVSKKLAAIQKIEASLGNVTQRLEKAGRDLELELVLLGLKWEDIVTVEIKKAGLTGLESSLKEDKALCSSKLSAEGTDSLLMVRTRIADEIEELTDKLDEPQRRYQQYTEDLKAWEERRAEIVGDEKTPGSISELEAEIAELDNVSPRLEKLKKDRLDTAGEIYDKLKELVGLFAELYEPVQQFIDRNATVQSKLGLSFDVFIRNENFESGFYGFVSRSHRGNFAGQEGPLFLRELIEKADFDNRESTMNFLSNIDECLHRERGKQDGESFIVKKQLRKGFEPLDLYDFVFGLGFLEPQYTLAMGGKQLSELSPGERGTLLLIFYLLVDDSKIPVILDQPDENLDNETVFELLVPCIREAKQERQIIIVTHNPNIAVVCDAEQVIHASIDKPGNYKITYEAGSIENPEMNKHLIDVLEGTRPAFDNRDSKYLE